MRFLLDLLSLLNLLNLLNYGLGEFLGALFLCGGGGRTVWWTGCLGTGLWTGGLYVRVWCGRFAGSYYVSVASAVQGTP